MYFRNDISRQFFRNGSDYHKLRGGDLYYIHHMHGQCASVWPTAVSLWLL